MNPRDFDIGKLVPIQNNTMYLVLFMLVVSLLLVAIARINKPNYIQGLLSTSTNMNKKILGTLSASSYFLVLNYLITFSIYIYLLITYNIINTASASFSKLTLILLFILLFHAVKIGVLFLISNWFNRFVYFDIANIIKYYQIIGLILLPITALSVFPNEGLHDFILIIGGIAMLVTGMVLRFKSFKEARQFNISYFYIILYLCTLEILPILIILKFVVD
ncbi:hypothetical protein DNU06_00180 [Putridiphycobacter roseus]|uniref:DUF4271 domain-containing protein n=1 Tax=Putridiphycobacter roseus TaxID=2219161 RepID=A0A2W1N1Y2_9FLAO|nr:DUF4271 domain-containing protein [Putridiphycobacter roseus]PZE18287.1 hypothetical protein DNU06_00180 [Putridiphycobacter roseus]